MVDNLMSDISITNDIIYNELDLYLPNHIINALHNVDLSKFDLDICSVSKNRNIISFILRTTLSPIEFEEKHNNLMIQDICEVISKDEKIKKLKIKLEQLKCFDMLFSPTEHLQQL